MTGPLFFAALVLLAVALPAVAGWKFRQKSSQNIRMLSTILGGQILLTPGILWLAFSADQNFGEDPTSAIIYYGVVALVISIMTFAIMEMRNSGKSK